MLADWARDDRRHGRTRRPRWAALAAVLVLGACGSPEERAASYLQKAQQLYDQGDYVAARLEAQNAVQVLPKDSQAHYLLALIAEQQQDFRSLLQQLLLAVDADPTLVPARVKLGTLYFLGKAYDQAAEQAKAATSLAPDDPQVRLLNARLLLNPGNDRAAGIRELDAALARDPDLVDAIILRAAAQAVTDPAGGLKILDDAITRLDRAKGKPMRQLRIALLAQENRAADVEQGYRELIHDFPKDEQIHFELARFYAKEGRPDEAEQVMRNVISAAPNDVSARIALVQLMTQMRSPAAAERTLEAFVSENPDQPELRATLGRLYEADGKPDAALGVYEELARREPKSRFGLAARGRIAALRIGAGEIEQARQIVTDMLTDDPENADALLIRSRLRVQDRQFSDALADVRTVLRRQPNSRQAMLLMAQIHSVMNERGMAKDAYRGLLTVDPKNAIASRELAALELRDGNTAGAEEVLRARLKVEPGDPQAANQLVEVLISRKAWREAEAEARRVDALPGDKVGLGQLLLARVYRAQDRKADAAAALRQVLDKAPQSPLALASLVALLQELGRGAEAKSLLDDYSRKYPSDFSARFIEGNDLARQGDTQGAAKIFSEIVAAQPNAIDAWNALAELNRADSARHIDIYKRGLAANPGNPALGLALSTAYEQAGRYEEAIANYQALLKTNPNSAPLLNNLVMNLLDRRADPASHAEALKLAKRMQNTTEPAGLDTVGWAYYRNKDYPRAVEFLERAVAAAEDVPLLNYHLGMAYVANGDRDSGLESLRQAVRTEKTAAPGVAEAEAALERL